MVRTMFSQIFHERASLLFYLMHVVFLWHFQLWIHFLWFVFLMLQRESPLAYMPLLHFLQIKCIFYRLFLLLLVPIFKIWEMRILLPPCRLVVGTKEDVDYLGTWHVLRKWSCVNIDCFSVYGWLLAPSPPPPSHSVHLSGRCWVSVLVLTTVPVQDLYLVAKC